MKQHELNWLTTFGLFDAKPIESSEEEAVVDYLEFNSPMEYTVLERIGAMSVEQRKEELNALGAQGWEAFAIIDHCVYLKRFSA